MLTKSQEKILEILSPLAEISKSKDKKPDEQQNITDIPELESEESAAQRRNKSSS